MELEAAPERSRAARVDGRQVRKVILLKSVKTLRQDQRGLYSALSEGGQELYVRVQRRPRQLPQGL